MRVKSQIERTIRHTVEIETNGFDIDPFQISEIGDEIANLTIGLGIDDLHCMMLDSDNERDEFYSIEIRKYGYIFRFELDEDFKVYTLVNIRKEEKIWK